MSTAASLQNLAAQPKALSNSSHAGLLLRRKCACGSPTSSLTGECAECGKAKQTLQRKLTIGASNDPLEQEADRVADQVLAAPAHPAVNSAPPRIQRFSRQSNGQMEAVPASVDQTLASPGRSLEPMLRQDMEQRFGYDFSSVAVHTNAGAVASAQSLGALAYTVGNHVVFGQGAYAPQTDAGRHLLAHELTHVVQQRTSGERLVQRFTGCNALMLIPALPGLASGRQVHTLLGAHFRAAVPGARNVAIPGASAAPQRTSGLCGDDTSVTKPQQIGGGAQSGVGLPDLAAINDRGVLLVAEIKPAATPCLVDGEEQLNRYIDQGNAQDDAARAWRASLGLRVVAPLLSTTYPAPDLPLPGPTPAIIATSWCTPGLLGYRVITPPVPVPVPDRGPVRQPSAVRSDRTYRLPDGVDWSTVAKVLAGIAAFLAAISIYGKIGAALGALLGMLLRALGFGLAFGASAAAASNSKGSGQRRSGPPIAGPGPGTGPSTGPPLPPVVAQAPPDRDQKPEPVRKGTPRTAKQAPTRTRPVKPAETVSHIEGLVHERLQAGMLPIVWLHKTGNEKDKIFAVLQVIDVTTSGGRTTVEFKSLLENRAGKNTLGGRFYRWSSPHDGKADWSGYRTFTGGDPDDHSFYLTYLDTLALELDDAGRSEAAEVRRETQRIRQIIGAKAGRR